jgi:WD40 repeat protein
MLVIGLAGLAGRCAAEPDSRDADEVRRLEGHTDKVCNLALSPDGRRLLSVSDDKTMRLWDLETGNQLRLLEGHTNFVLGVAFSPDGKRALSGSGGEFLNNRFSAGSDKSLRLWDLDSGRELLNLAHGAPVWNVGFLDDGRTAYSVTGDSEHALRIWDLDSGKELRRVGTRQHSGQGVALSPDRKRIVTAGKPPDLSARVWDVEIGREVRRLEGHNAVIRGAAWSPDGRQILTGGGNFVAGGLETTLRLWNADTGVELRLFEGHSELVWCVAFSPDGKQALSGSVDGSVRLWDLETGKELHRFKGHAVAENDARVGPRADVRAVLFTPDGRRAVSAGHDKLIRVWNLPRRQR